MKGNRYVQSRIFLKALIINWFFFKKRSQKKKEEEARRGRSYRSKIRDLKYM